MLEVACDALAERAWARRRADDRDACRVQQPGKLVMAVKRASRPGILRSRFHRSTPQYSHSRLRLRGANEQASYAPPIPCPRSEEHTSELQSLMRITYAVFCLKKK